MIRTMFFECGRDLEEFLKGLQRKQIISIFSYGMKIILVYEEKVGK